MKKEIKNSISKEAQAAMTESTTLNCKAWVTNPEIQEERPDESHKELSFWDFLYNSVSNIFNHAN